MNKIAEKRTDEIVGEYHDGDYTDHSRHNTRWCSFKEGYDQAMQDMDNLQKDAKCQEETEEVTLAKLNATIQYNQGLKDGYNQALQDFDEQYKIAYVVTRSDLHYDEVEKVFFDEKKAEEYCKPFNEDKNSYHRNITKIEVSL